MYVHNSRPSYIMPAFFWLRRHYTFSCLAYLDACGSCCLNIHLKPLLLLLPTRPLPSTYMPLHFKQ